MALGTYCWRFSLDERCRPLLSTLTGGAQVLSGAQRVDFVHDFEPSHLWLLSNRAQSLVPLPLLRTSPRPSGWGGVMFMWRGGVPLASAFYGCARCQALSSPCASRRPCGDCGLEASSKRHVGRYACLVSRPRVGRGGDLCKTSLRTDRRAATDGRVVDGRLVQCENVSLRWSLPPARYRRSPYDDAALRRPFIDNRISRQVAREGDGQARQTMRMNACIRRYLSLSLSLSSPLRRLWLGPK